jgi:hypothetical protein
MAQGLLRRPRQHRCPCDISWPVSIIAPAGGMVTRSRFSNCSNALRLFQRGDVVKRFLKSMLVASVVIGLAPHIAVAGQQPANAAPRTPEENEELAKKLSNPISDLVSVPFQFNWYQDVGPLDLSTFILNVQPVIPLELNKDWNLILRIIVPFIGQPPLFIGDLSAFGVGDVTSSFFFSPRNSSGFTWGVGPVFETPSSYQPTIGSGHFSIGPTAVALQQTGKWTIGVLGNQVWSVAGDSRRADVNQMFLQPFLAYQKTHTVTLTLTSEMTANWEAHGEERWTVPILGDISKLDKFGPFPASYELGAAWLPAHPDVGPSWSIRGAVTILLPERK